MDKEKIFDDLISLIIDFANLSFEIGRIDSVRSALAFDNDLLIDIINKDCEMKNNRDFLQKQIFQKIREIL